MSKHNQFFLLIALIFFAITKTNAQTKTSTDTSFKPGGRIWGLAFGDYYSKVHADSLNRGSYQYSKVPKNTNAFQFRRIYLGYSYDFSSKFSADLLLAGEDDFTSSTSGVSTGTAGDVLSDNKFSFYIKYANIKWKNIWKGTDFIVGLQPTPLAAILSEPAWAFRPIERTIADFNKSNTSDLGAGFQGRFDPGTDNFGYDLLVANGTKSVPESDNFKWFYGDVWGRFLDKKLWIDLYIDYNKLGYTGIGVANAHSRNMYKATVAYISSSITVGVEGFINANKNDALGVNKSSGDTTVENATAKGISFYARGKIIKDKLGFFARYDNFNPDTKWGDNGITGYITKTTGSYSAASVYDVNTKTDFITAGLDFSPAKNVHFMPNVWYVRYSSQKANLTGAAAHDYDLVYRLTFYYTFGNNRN